MTTSSAPLVRKKLSRQPFGHQQLAHRVARLPDTDLVELWQALLTRLSEPRRLELALLAAESLPASLGALRSVLTADANRARIAEQLCGDPRRVVDLATAADESLRQARIAGEAMTAIWEEEMLTSSEVARRLGAKPSNREKVRALRLRSAILGLPQDGGRRYLHPAFQIDLARREVHPEARKINEILDAASDPWGVASWWISSNGRLGDARPADLVGTGAGEALLRAAGSVREPLG